MATLSPRINTAEVKVAAMDKVGLTLGMVLAQILTTTSMLLNKLALDAGSSPFVLIVYRTLIGAIVVLPLAIYFERDRVKDINIKVLWLIFANAALGAPLAQGMAYYGMRATDAAYATTFLNLAPVVTFVIAIVFGTEKVVFTKWPSVVKLLSTGVCVGGTMLVSLYKGNLLQLWHTHLLKSQSNNVNQHHDMIAGTIFLCVSCLSNALWYLAQAKLTKEFSSRYISTTLACLMGSMQSAVIALIIGTDASAWKIKWDVELLAVVFSGMFSSGATYILNVWGITRRGPIYPTMFSPLSLIMTTVLNSLLFGTHISLGSVLGTVMIMIGLYAFLWAQGKEMAAAKAAARQEHDLIEPITSLP